jgi:hypothetical protein
MSGEGQGKSCLALEMDVPLLGGAVRKVVCLPSLGSQGGAAGGTRAWSCFTLGVPAASGTVANGCCADSGRPAVPHSLVPNLGRLPESRIRVMPGSICL